MDTPIPYTLTDPPTDFEGTARAMRGDLRASGWTEVVAARVERWRSPDHKRDLPLVDAWDRARRDAVDAARPAAGATADWIERPPGFEVVESVHGANVAAGGHSEKCR